MRDETTSQFSELGIFFFRGFMLWRFLKMKCCTESMRIHNRWSHNHFCQCLLSNRLESSSHRRPPSSKPHEKRILFFIILFFNLHLLEDVAFLCSCHLPTEWSLSLSLSVGCPSAPCCSRTWLMLHAVCSSDASFRSNRFNYHTAAAGVNHFEEQN